MVVACMMQKFSSDTHTWLLHVHVHEFKLYVADFYHILIYIRRYVHTFTPMYSKYIHTFTGNMHKIGKHTCVHVQVHTYVHKYVHTFYHSIITYACTVCMFIQMHVCTYVCIYICMCWSCQ